MNVSIVIPAYGSYHLLDECLRRLYQNTDISGLQIIVVCNGTDDESPKLVMQNGLQLIWYKEAIGFTKATNAGLKLVTNPITVVMNTDTHILDFWPKNQWLETLIQPFENDDVGITGLSTMRSEWGEFIPFYFVGIRSELFTKIGLLDENFNPGYGEDLDFCLRVKQEGYKIVEIDKGVEDHHNHRMISNFPIYHKGQQSFSNEQRDWCLKNAHEVMKCKWG